MADYRLRWDRRLFFNDSYGNSYCCSLRRTRLMRCHNLASIFRGGIQGFVFLSNRRRPGSPRAIKPIFNHPHDLWAARRGSQGIFIGRIVQASYDGKAGFSGWDKAPKHLLIKLEENVFAFAETTIALDCHELVGKEVTFYFCRYNSKTKKIYGQI